MPAVSAHFVYERPYSLYRSLGRDCVAEIEDVAGLRSESIEHAARCFANRGLGREQREWIQIPLQRDAVVRKLARCARVAGPIEADGACAARYQLREPWVAAFREDDRRHV